MYSIQKVTKDNYPLLVSWWNDHKMAALPQSHTPQEGGFIAYNIANEPVIAGFCFATDSAWGIFTWVVANPKIKGLDRTLAFSFLCEHMVEYSKSIGVKHLLTFAKGSLSVRFKANGFLQMNDEMQELIREVK